MLIIAGCLVYARLLVIIASLEFYLFFFGMKDRWAKLESCFWLMPWSRLSLFLPIFNQFEVGETEICQLVIFLFSPIFNQFEVRETKIWQLPSPRRRRRSPAGKSARLLGWWWRGPLAWPVSRCVLAGDDVRRPWRLGGAVPSSSDVDACCRSMVRRGGAQARGGGSQWRQLACRSMGPLASGFSAHCDDGRALHRWAEAVNPIAWRRAGIQHRINQAQQLHPQGRSFGRRSSSESNARLPAGAENGNVLDTSHSCIRSTRWEAGWKCSGLSFSSMIQFYRLMLSYIFSNALMGSICTKI
jgi:hypothetical protein